MHILIFKGERISFTKIFHGIISIKVIKVEQYLLIRKSELIGKYTLTVYGVFLLLFFLTLKTLKALRNIWPA